MLQQITTQQIKFITNNESRISSTTAPDEAMAPPLTTASSRGFGILQIVTLDAPPGNPSATVTPTSTPPIRVSRLRRGDGSMSPAPLATEHQKKFYDDSTWRMYDRIQASRPLTLKQCMLLPPTSSLSRPPISSLMSMPRFSQRHQSQGEQDPAVLAMEDEEEEELIFDLEL